MKSVKKEYSTCLESGAKLTAFILIIAGIWYVCSACSKQGVIQTPDVYKLISVHYKLDTTDAKVYVLWQDRVYRVEEKRRLDTIKPVWLPLCNVNLEKIGIEYRYYMKNEIIIK